MTKRVERLRVGATGLAKEDPAVWIETRADGELWSKLREICDSVRDNRRTAVHSCHKIGKTWLAAHIVAWWIDAHELGEALALTSAHSGTQVKVGLWREIGRLHAQAGLVGRTNMTEWHVPIAGSREEIVALGRKPKDTDLGAFHGAHSKNGLVVFDEACWIPEPLWNGADTLMAGENARFLAISNPDDPTSHFAKLCQPGSGWNVIHIGKDETPNFSGESVSDDLRARIIGPTWVEEKRQQWGEGSALWVSKVLGQWPESSADGLIPLQWLRAAQERDLAPTEPSQLGVDVGRGGDRSVMVHRRGPHARVVRRDTIPDTMQTAGNVIAEADARVCSTIKVDVIGIGAGVVDRLAEQSKPVVGVNVGASARNPEKFTNLRAEGYWALRERFEDGTIDLDPADDELAAQLTAIRYKRTSSGKIQIESKEEMKRRIGRSPDEADALMLAFIDSEPGYALTF